MAKLFSDRRVRNLPLDTLRDNKMLKYCMLQDNSTKIVLCV